MKSEMLCMLNKEMESCDSKGFWHRCLGNRSGNDIHLYDCNEGYYILADRVYTGKSAIFLQVFFPKILLPARQTKTYDVQIEHYHITAI